MQTICPHCQTIFKVADEHLKAADGYVRCGICKEVFNALETDLPEEQKKPTVQAETTEPTETSVEKITEPDNTEPVDFVLEQSDEVIADEEQDSLSASEDISDKEETTDSIENIQSNLFATPSETTEPEAIVTSTSSEPDTTKTESHSNNNDMDNSLFDGVQSKLIPDEYRIPEPHNTCSFWQDLAWSMTILILTASLFVEYAWFNRNELISNPQLNPFITQICSITNCEAMDLREPGQIEMTTRNIYTHPNVKNALMISGTLINHAQFDQPYPNILIAFSNVRGEVIASRTFTPENYLQIKSTSLRLLPPRMPIDFNMEIQDPGKHAMTYEFSFL